MDNYLFKIDYYESDKNKKRIGKSIKNLSNVSCDTPYKLILTAKDNKRIILRSNDIKCEYMSEVFNNKIQETVVNIKITLNKIPIKTMHKFHYSEGSIQNIKLEGFAYDTDKYGDLSDPYIYICDCGNDFSLSPITINKYEDKDTRVNCMFIKRTSKLV